MRITLQSLNYFYSFLAVWSTDTQLVVIPQYPLSTILNKKQTMKTTKWISPTKVPVLDNSGWFRNIFVCCAKCSDSAVYIKCTENASGCMYNVRSVISRFQFDACGGVGWWQQCDMHAWWMRWGVGGGTNTNSWYGTREPPMHEHFHAYFHEWALSHEFSWITTFIEKNIQKGLKGTFEHGYLVGLVCPIIGIRNTWIPYYAFSNVRIRTICIPNMLEYIEYVF